MDTTHWSPLWLLAPVPTQLQGMTMGLYKQYFEVTYELAKHLCLIHFPLQAFFTTTSARQEHVFEWIKMASYLPTAEQRLKREKQKTTSLLSNLGTSVIIQGWPNSKAELYHPTDPFI